MKCKKGKKGRFCRLKKKSKKLIPMKGERLIVWLSGAGLELVGFFFFFGEKLYIIGGLLVAIGLIVALASRQMK